jgi:hypothetical protein
MSMRVLTAIAPVVCLVMACGGGVEGEYIGKKGESFFDSLTLRSGGKLEVVLIGVRHEGAYVVEDDQVTITAPSGDRTPLRLDSNGCLTHPIAGIYCRSGRSPAASAERASTAEPTGGSSAFAGAAADESDPPGAEVYEARAREGQIRLELRAARTARITMVPTGITDAPERMSFDVSYAVDGSQITVSLPGNEPLLLTRAGSDLEGTMNGETVRFVKR